MKIMLQPAFQGQFDVYAFNEPNASLATHSPTLENVTYPQFYAWFHNQPGSSVALPDGGWKVVREWQAGSNASVEALPTGSSDLIWLCEAGQRVSHPAHSKSYCKATFASPRHYRYCQEREIVENPASQQDLLTLNIDGLSKLDTECGYRNHAAGLAADWKQLRVAVPYSNAFGERIVAAFTARLYADEQRAILDLSFVDGSTCLQFEAPAAWANAANVPFAGYRGEYDSLPAAGLGGNFGEVRQHGNGAVVLTPELAKLAAAYHDEQSKAIEY